MGQPRTMAFPATFACLWLALFWGLKSHGFANAERPSHTEYAQMARWLVHANSWGVIASVSSENQPLSGVESYSDGLVDSSTGRVFFYMTPMDESTINLLARPRCSFTITEAQLHPQGCGTTDPEDPSCAKLSLLGEVRSVPAGERDMARKFLFARHPAMASWPADHGFNMYELHIKSIHLLDWYGGMHYVSLEDYFSADSSKVNQHAASAAAAVKTRKSGGRKTVAPS